MCGMNLPMRCSDCAVAASCPAKGASPLIISGAQHLCEIVGGYGREPVDPAILSPESAARAAQHGPCLTIAEVPEVDGGVVRYKVVKVFSQPVRAAREKNAPVTSSNVAVRSHK